MRACRLACRPGAQPPPAGRGAAPPATRLLGSFRRIHLSPCDHRLGTAGQSAGTGRAIILCSTRPCPPFLHKFLHGRGLLLQGSSGKATGGRGVVAAVVRAIAWAQVGAPISLECIGIRFSLLLVSDVVSPAHVDCFRVNDVAIRVSPLRPAWIIRGGRGTEVADKRGRAALRPGSHGWRFAGRLVRAACHGIAPRRSRAAGRWATTHGGARIDTAASRSHAGHPRAGRCGRPLGRPQRWGIAQGGTTASHSQAGRPCAGRRSRPLGRIHRDGAPRTRPGQARACAEPPRARLRLSGRPRGRQRLQAIVRQGTRRSSLRRADRTGGDGGVEAGAAGSASIVQ